MIKAFKYRIYPNQEQKQLLCSTFGHNRFMWNHMLSERISIYEQLKDDKEQLFKHKYRTEKEYKADFVFLSEVDSVTLQQTRLNLNQSYQNFYRKVRKNATEKGFPKFKKKSNTQSAKTVNTNDNCKIDFDLKKIKLPKLGWINYQDDRIFYSKIKSVTVSKNTSNQYFASILTDTNELPKVSL